MKQLIVRYKLKPGRQGENEAYVQRVFDALKESAPPGIRYASLQLEDELSFIHIAQIFAEDGSNPLSALDAFKAFTRDIAERCDDPPTASDFSLVGNHHLFN